MVTSFHFSDAGWMIKGKIDYEYDVVKNYIEMKPY